MYTSSIASRARNQSARSFTPRVLATCLLVAALTFSLVSVTGNVAEAAGPVVGSSISVYITCPGTISFALQTASGPCGSGNYTGVYTGISQMPVANLTSEFYLASASGGVKVTFNLTDATTGKLLLNGVGYGAIDGGSCSSPSLVIATGFTTSANVINSGDRLEASLNTTFTGTGTPAFCAGGSDATLISFKTAVPGSAHPLFSSMLNPGKPAQTMLLGYEGVAENYTNPSGVAITAIVQGVVKNQAGNTVDVLSSSITLSPGAEVTAFLAFNKYPSGSYTVTVIALTSSDVPIAAPVVAEVSV